MEQKTSVQAITYVISGELLQLTGYVGGSWIGNLIVIIGLCFFLYGLTELKFLLDYKGQKGVSMLIVAAIIGIGASLIDFISFFGFIPALLSITAFILQIIGFMRLGQSDSIGTNGKSGTTLMFAAMGFAIVAEALGIIPFVGSFMGGFFAIGAVLCCLFGWIRLQDGILSKLTPTTF